MRLVGIVHSAMFSLPLNPPPCASLEGDLFCLWRFSTLRLRLGRKPHLWEAIWKMAVERGWSIPARPQADREAAFRSVGD
jgi:hypothetical protein